MLNTFEHVAPFWALGLVVLIFLPAGVAAEEATAKEPILYEYVRDTLSRHPLMEQARAELRASEARAEAKSRPLYNPELGFGFEDGEDRTKEVGISQTFDLFGKRRAQERVGIAEVDAARASLDITGKTFLADLLTAIADFRTTERLFFLATERVELTEDFLGLAERRYTAGDLPLNELLAARVALSEAKAQKNEAAIAFAEAKSTLIGIVGLEKGFWPHLPPSAPPSLPDQLAQTRLEELPELRYAQATIRINQSAVRVAKRNRLPDPTLSVRIGEENSQRLIGVRLSVPIPVLNTFRAEVEAAGADVIAAEQSYRSLRRELQAALEAARTQFNSSLEAWLDWEKTGATDLQKQRTTLQRLWETGEISAVDFLILFDQTFEAEQAAVSLKGRVWSTWFRWLEISATGDEWMEALR